MSRDALHMVFAFLVGAAVGMVTVFALVAIIDIW